MSNIYYSYETFVDDVKKLVEETKSFEPDALLAIARGGLTLAHAYALATNNRNLFSVNSVLYDGETKRSHAKLTNIPDLAGMKRVLILDDIVDSGETLKGVLRVLQERYPDIDFRSASLYYKSASDIQPDYTLHEATEWIDFFWEKDFLDE
jgi:xanthine phosphoribosyltransferase